MTCKKRKALNNCASGRNREAPSSQAYSHNRKSQFSQLLISQSLRSSCRITDNILAIGCFCYVCSCFLSFLLTLKHAESTFREQITKLSHPHESIVSSM